ncbi:SOS response-associated peptidase [Ramlibacter sp.]|uniref:SOS response-associated peptidase n=1 Tax=Ramlibacter sp. TaxID=1917967 RepID=UPI003D0E31A4
MCSNYVPVSRRDRLLTFFGVERERDDPATDAWPVGMAPFIHLAGGEVRVVSDGLFGLLPHFATEVSYGRRTYNARSETVRVLPSFKEAWAKGWRCIIPAESIYEPNWETGQSVRWAIHQEGFIPMGIAGIYRRWRDPKDNREVYSFAMLTVNADGHPLMKRFHRPEDEKRMVVMLRPADYAEWLSCPVEDAARFFRQWDGPLLAEPVPLPPRAPKASSVRTVRPPKPETGSLF